MTCKELEKLLSSYIEGELGEADRSMVEEHLRACPTCSLLLAGLEEARQALRSFPELEVSEDLKAKLYAIPAKKKRFRLKLKLSLDFLLQPSLQPVFAAASVFMILVSAYFFHPNRTAIEKSISRSLHLGYSQAEKIFARADMWIDRLNGYKDNVILTLKESQLLGGKENNSLQEEETLWKKKSS